MKKREIISSLFWLVCGVVLSGLSLTYPPGSATQPGAGFLPLILGILLVAFSLVLLFRAWNMARGRGGKGQLFPAGAKRVPLIVAVLLAAIFAFEAAGYLLTFLFLGILLPILTGWMTWRASLVFAALAVAGIYVIFIWLLKQPLPAGFLGV